MIGIGANGVQFLDASDPDRAVLGEYDFSAIESFLCEAPVRNAERCQLLAVERYPLDRTAT